MGDWGGKNHGPYSRENKKVIFSFHLNKIKNNPTNNLENEDFMYKHIFLETKILTMEERLQSEKMRNGKINSPVRKLSWKAFKKKLVSQRCACLIFIYPFQQKCFLTQPSLHLSSRVYRLQPQVSHWTQMEVNVIFV